MTELCDETINSKLLKYELFGIINHFGSIEEGHYNCIVKIENFWYEFNDSTVNKINKLNYISDSVCIFLYRRIPIKV